MSKLTSTVTLHLGKTPARKDAASFKFATYANAAALPVPPDAFGHETLLPANGWGMMANDSVGDCVVAGAIHETMLWTAESSAPAVFTDAKAIKAYSAITGYKPGDPSTDNGTDMEVAAKYRRQTGIKDCSHVTHKIGAYLALTAGNLPQFLQAAYLFSAVGIGIQFPASAMTQFNAGQPWDVVKGAKIEGGHYVSIVGFRAGMLQVVTWGRIQSMTVAFFKKYCDEGLCYLSPEMLKGGLSPEGFNLAALQADLAQLAKP